MRSARPTSSGSSAPTRSQSGRSRRSREIRATPRSSSRLGIDPQTWLTNLSNEGDEEVGGTETIHIHGDADVDADRLRSGGSSQRAPGGAAEAVDPAQLEQLKSAIEDASLDVYSGKDDRILRKLSLSLSIVPPEGASGATVSRVDVDLSVTVSDLNKPQTISAPPNAKPLSGLLGQLGRPRPRHAGALGLAATWGWGRRPRPRISEMH